MAVIANVALVAPCALVWRRNRTGRGLLAGMVLGGVVSLALCIVCNIVVTPLYTAVSTEAVIGMIVPILVPFNLMKIVLNCVLCALVMKPMAKVLVQD